MVAADRNEAAQSDDKLRQRAFKQIIEICEDSISRNDVHMTIQCSKCSKCKTCKEIKKIYASSYNDFMEQQAMEQLVRFVDGENGKPGYFISPLPLKPFNINSVRGNRSTADEQNKKMLVKLQQDPEAPSLVSPWFTAFSFVHGLVHGPELRSRTCADINLSGHEQSRHIQLVHVRSVN